MNKKGFTMIELLAIIVILSMISIVSISSIVNMNNKIDENSDLYDTIYMAAETYVYNNYSNYSELNEVNSTSLISVIELINNDYLKSNIINPKDNEKFTSADYIKVKRNNDMTLSFDIVDSFPVVIKLNIKNSYITNSEEFVTAIFDIKGGNVECSNQFGVLENLTYQSLAIGTNIITCNAVANNGTSATLTKTIDVNGYFDYNDLTVSENGYKNNNITLVENSIVTGPGHKIFSGCYYVEINGNGFTDGIISAYEKTNSENIISTLQTNIVNDKITYYINLTENLQNGIELYFKNTATNNVTINNITVNKIDSCPT